MYYKLDTPVSMSQTFESEPTTPFVPSDDNDHDALYMGGYGGEISPNRRRPNSIDYSKFKTKMCRNYQMGLPCPFEDRCAFAHGPVQMRANMPPPPPSYQEATESANPPPYSSTGIIAAESPVDSRSSTPPQYHTHLPNRYRYEPYSGAGIIYQN